MDSITKTLVAYRHHIKEITQKYPNSPISQEIERESQSIDAFIKSWYQLDKAQKKFEKYLEGANISFSPERKSSLTGLLPGIQESESFKEWSDYVANCIGDN